MCRLVPFIERTFTWELSQDGIAVKTTFHVNPLSHVDQTAEETLTLEVSHHNTTKVLQEVWLRRLIFPQEFLMFIANRNDFEFVGWWKNWSLAQPLDNFQANNRSIVLVKRVHRRTRAPRSPMAHECRCLVVSAERPHRAENQPHRDTRTGR